MLTRTMAVAILVHCALYSGPLIGQEKPAAIPPPSGVREFPMLMQQGVTAGKTSAGSKVQARHK